MRLLRTLALATGYLLPPLFASLIPEGTLQAFGARKQTIQTRDVAASSPSGRLFDIYGKVQYFAGTNAWWLGHLTSDADLDAAMSEIAQSVLRVVRVWGFGNVNVRTKDRVYYQLLSSSAGSNSASINFASNGIPRLDAVVASAEKYNVQLVLAMLNNWSNLGGINTYCNVFGCNATTFYTDAAAQRAYQAYIAFVVNRYKSSSAIFS